MDAKTISIRILPPSRFLFRWDWFCIFLRNRRVSHCFIVTPKINILFLSHRVKIEITLPTKIVVCFFFFLGRLSKWLLSRISPPPNYLLTCADNILLPLLGFYTITRQILFSNSSLSLSKINSTSRIIILHLFSLILFYYYEEMITQTEFDE